MLKLLAVGSKCADASQDHYTATDTAHTAVESLTVGSSFHPRHPCTLLHKPHPSSDRKLNFVTLIAAIGDLKETLACIIKHIHSHSGSK